MSFVEQLRKTVSVRTVVCLAAFFIYLFSVFFARNFLHDATLFLVVLPIIASAMGFGLPVAIIPILLCCILNLVFVEIYSAEISVQLSVGAKIAGTVGIFLFGIALACIKTTMQRLRAALEEIKHLSGLLPMCAGCKKIRNDTGYWQEVEEHIESHSEAEFSHGLCPDCMKEHLPEYFEILEKR